MGAVARGARWKGCSRRDKAKSGGQMIVCANVGAGGSESRYVEGLLAQR